MKCFSFLESSEPSAVVLKEVEKPEGRDLYIFFLSSMSNCALGRVGYIMEHPSHPPPLFSARHEFFSSCVPSPPASFQAVTAAWAVFLIAKARQDQIRPWRLVMPLAQAAMDPSSANVI
ncbi:uncharacterized [Tachysurus ichikawai]